MTVASAIAFSQSSADCKGLEVVGVIVGYWLGKADTGAGNPTALDSHFQMSFAQVSEESAMLGCPCIVPRAQV